MTHIDILINTDILYMCMYIYIHIHKCNITLYIIREHKHMLEKRTISLKKRNISYLGKPLISKINTKKIRKFFQKILFKFTLTAEY